MIFDRIKSLRQAEGDPPYKFHLEAERSPRGTSMVIQGVVGISEFNSDTIELLSHGGRIILCGKLLRVFVLDSGAVEVSGKYTRSDYPMVKIDKLILGYRIINLDPADLLNISSRLLRDGLTAEIDPSGIVTVRERDLDRTLYHIGKAKYSVSPSKGLLGWLRRVKNKVAFLISFILSALLIIGCSSVVWDIRIEGNEELSDSYVREVLSDCGFEIGDGWNKINRGELELSVLSNCSKISWININRRGTVAYVSLIEKKGQTANPPVEIQYSNIVAEKDCVIEEIMVKRGKALVKVGDAVRKGEILIEGIEPEEFGGKLCRAEGTVIGRVNETLTVFVDRAYEKKEITGSSIKKIKVNILKFCANIFKKDGNFVNECDIIEEVKTFSLFGDCILPIELIVEKQINYTTVSGKYSDDRLTKIAASRMSALISIALSDCDLIRIRTAGEYTDSGYGMYSEVSYTQPIGVERQLNVNNGPKD